MEGITRLPKSFAPGYQVEAQQDGGIDRLWVSQKCTGVFSTVADMEVGMVFNVTHPYLNGGVWGVACPTKKSSTPGGRGGAGLLPAKVASETHFS